MNSPYTNAQSLDAFQIENYSNKVQQKNLIKSILVGFLSTLLIAGLVISIYFISTASSNNTPNLTITQPSSHNTIPNSHLEVQVLTLEQYPTSEFAGNTQRQQAQNSAQLLRISRNEYPNLRKLIISIPNLQVLQLEEGLKLDTLVVNNSQLVSFSYNSSDLKTLLLVDNKKMTSFIDSSLPALSNLTIIRSNIQTWSSNTFGNLSYAAFFESALSKLPTLNASSVEEMIVSNCNVSVPTSYFSSSPVRRFTQSGGQQPQTLSVHGSSVLQHIQITNCSYESIILWSCSALTQISIVGNNLASLTLNELPEHLNVAVNMTKISLLQIMNLTMPNLTVFQGIQIHSLTVTKTVLETLNLDWKGLVQVNADYQHIQDNLFNITSPLLSSISISNYNSKSAFNSSSWPLLDHFTIDNAILPGIILEFTKITSISLHFITSPNGQFELILNGSKIQSLEIVGVDISSFSNYILQLNAIILLNNSNLKTMQNNTINSSLLQIVSNSQLQVFSNNTQHYDYAIFKQNPKLAFNEPLNATEIQLRANKDFDIQNLNTLIPETVYLIYDDYNTEAFNNITIQTLQTLDIGCSFLNNFTNNDLPALQHLTISSNLEIFQNNTLNLLKHIDLSNGNNNLNFQVFIAELKQLKEKGMDGLEYIILPSSANERQIEQIKEMFPEAIVR